MFHYLCEGAEETRQGDEGDAAVPSCPFDECSQLIGMIFKSMHSENDRSLILRCFVESKDLPGRTPVDLLKGSEGPDYLLRRFLGTPRRDFGVSVPWNSPLPPQNESAADSSRFSSLRLGEGCGLPHDLVYLRHSIEAKVSEALVLGMKCRGWVRIGSWAGFPYSSLYQTISNETTLHARALSIMPRNPVGHARARLITNHLEKTKKITPH